MIKVSITNFGKALLVKALHNDSAIKFLSMGLGTGDDAPADVSGMQDLRNKIMECSITEMTKGANYIQLTCVFDNNEVEADFEIKEIGVYAEDAAHEKGLFAYVNQKDRPEPVFGRDSEKLKENSISVQIIVDDAKNVSASIKSLTWASKEDLENHIHDYNNPHRVTKEQVGLGNAENYAFADAPINFKASDELQNIASGETLSTLFGKIYTAIKRFIQHLQDRNNPHKVTAAQIGAAAAGHYHAASDINKGTLGVTRGGTGKSEWTDGLLLVGAAENTLSQMSRPTEPALLIQSPSGPPEFKPLTEFTFWETGASEPKAHNVFWVDPDPIYGGLKYYKANVGWVHVPVAYSKEA